MATQVAKGPSQGGNGDYQAFPNVSRRNSAQGFIEIPLMIRALGIPAGRRILEVGCGIGNALQPLARLCRPTRLAGIDIDPELLAHEAATLRRQHVAAELHHGDVRSMPFPNASFDIVIDFGTCYHIARSDDAIREVSRVLTEEGLFIYETKLNQFLSHPVRSYGRRLPWNATYELQPDGTAVLWGRRKKNANSRSSNAKHPAPTVGR